MKRSVSVILIAVLLALGFSQYLLQRKIDPFWADNYATRGENFVVQGLSPEQFLVALNGFREFVAGILWVRADEFFHTGNYDAILPMVRIVTWLDPHQLDVYSTGAWHMAYNFTDTQQRSDRRYIFPALTLLKEGVENNPVVFDLYFENGWMYYHKIEEHYDLAARWLEEATTKKDMIEARRSMVAHAYEKDGQIGKAINAWYEVVDRAVTRLNQDPDNWEYYVQRDTTENNLDITILRSVARKYDTQPPIDVRFGVRVTVPEPKKLTIKGQMVLGTIGARVRFILKDEGYVNPDRGLDPNEKLTDEFSFDVPKKLTYLQDLLYNRNYKFTRDVDMSKDPSMYPFKADKYDMVFYWNPRMAGPHIQDRTGFNGEGITDKRYLRDGYQLKGRPKPSPDAKWNVIYCQLSITKDQLLRKGEWTDKVPVIETPGFVEPPDPVR